MKEPEKNTNETSTLPPILEQDGYIPKTELGRKLLALRQQAIAEGMTLMTNDEILAEIEYRRYGRKVEGYDENSYLY